MERDIVKPPSVGTGVRRVPFVKGAGVFFPSSTLSRLSSQTHCLSKGRTLVTATPLEPAGAKGPVHRSPGRDGEGRKGRGGEKEKEKVRKGG